MVGLEVDGTVATSCIAPSISVNPAGATKNVGESVTFSVTASGTAPLSYQWRKGGVNISGATSASYNIPSVAVGDAGSYDVVVSNACGSVTSSAATLTVNATTSLALAAPTPSSFTFGSPAPPITLTATLSPALAGQTVTFTIGTSPTTNLPTSTNGSGVATVLYNPPGLNAGTYTVSAAFAGAIVGSVVYSASTSNTQTFDVLKANQTITFGALAAKTYGDPAFTVSATGGASGNPVTFGATGNCNSSGLNGSTITITGAGSCTVTASQSGNANYNAAPNVPQTFTINQKTLTQNITADNKVYDGNTLATILTRTLSGGIVGTDDVSLTGGTATFDNKNAGTGKTVTATGLTLSGAAAGNYVLSSTSATTTANITAKPLTPTVTVNNKVYDGNTSATIATLSLASVIAPDAVTLSGGTANFTDKNAGTGKTVNITGLTLTGADAANYSISGTATATADITPRGLNVSATAQNKIYDGTTAAIATLSDDRVSGNVLSITFTSATFSDKNVGTGKTVTISGIAVSGTDSGNYSLSNTTAAATADITARTLTISATGINKVYDGNTTATVTLSSDAVAGDLLTLSYTSASFADKSVGTGKPVSVTGISFTGADAGNYQAGNTTASTTANITGRALAVTATAASKSYDGSTTASVTLADDRIAGDVFTVSFTSATFVDKNVGMGKTVTVSGISTSGTDAGNYSANTSTTATADISALAITGSITAANKVYDGTTAAAILTRSLSGQISGDIVTYDGGTATFANKNVATGKTVTATGLGLTGVDAGNYTVNTTAVTTADITPRGLTVSATGINKVYDGSTNATVTLSDDKVSGDDISTAYTSASFDNKNIGTGKPVAVTGISISGADAGNYTFNTTASTTADITARALTVTAAGVNKVYDAITTATVNLSDDKVSGDTVTTSYASATFDTKNVGTGKPVAVSGISISGADAGNYTFNTTASTTADITALAITGSITADNKVYNGTTSATILSRTLSGAVSGDTVNCIGGTATFDNKNVGTGKTVTATGLSLSGADAGNYTVNSTATTTANITPRTLTVTATAASKVFDGTTTATATLFDNRVAGDLLTLSYTSANFSDPNVGTGKTVTVSGISISGGTDAGNYSLGNTTATTTANITVFGTTTSITVSPGSQQYSDKVSFTATINPGFAGIVPAAANVTFYVGTQSIGSAALSAGTGADAGKLVGTLSNVALLETVANQMSPGSKTVTAVFGGVNPNFTVISAATGLTITQEDAAATYSGSQYFATASPSSTTATVTLSATIVDNNDGARGDIRKAVVEFHRDTPTGTLLGTASPVGLVNTTDSTVCTATTTFNYNLTGSEANSLGTTLTVYVVVKGYYTSVSELANISIVIPGTNSVNGGGFLVMQNSNGQFAGLTGSKMNFGYTMKYNNSGRNLQGQANIIVRGANGKVYQIKSNAIDSLAVAGTNYPKNGTFTTKANMTDISDPLNPISLGGNLRLQVDMTDAATGGQTDKVGITLWNADGGLYFTSNWNGTTTIQQLLGGGNISVR